MRRILYQWTRFYTAYVAIYDLYFSSLSLDEKKRIIRMRSCRCAGFMSHTEQK
ncbi:MAG TPA: hypothetical protein VM884_01255 [Flavisolibacter sp.]|nr:hypothetical protein [Flavisolibacter sp.]